MKQKKFVAKLWTKLIITAAAGLMAFTAVVGTATASDSVVVERIVAQVNDEIVTLYELEEAAYPYVLQRGGNPQVLRNEARKQELLADVLEDLVDRMLLEQEAKRRGVEVGEAQIDEWIAMNRQQQGLSEQQFRQMIAQYGIDFEEYREIIRHNLLQMQLMQMRGRGGGVSRSDVESEYRRRYGSEFDTERRLEFRHILIIPDAEEGGREAALQQAADLRDRIVAGESFSELAEQYSQGPGSNDGGYIGDFARGDLDESFERVAFELEVGELSEPVVTDFGVHLIEVLSEEEVASDRVSRRMEQIHMELQEREAERQLQSYLQTLRARAFVDIRY